MRRSRLRDLRHDELDLHVVPPRRCPAADRAGGSFGRAGAAWRRTSFPRHCMTQDQAELALMERIAQGFMVESEEDMTPGYKKALLTQLTVQGDTELLSAPAYYLASRDAPTLNS